MILLLGATIAAGIVLPHLLPLRRVPPVTAMVVWVCSLALRGLAWTLVVLYLLFFLPGTDLFAVVTHWCWDAFLPIVAGEHTLDGHRVGDLAVLLPALLVCVSLLMIVARIARGARLARTVVEHHALGHGPRDSLIVSGPEVVFAVAGITRPRIVVSAGALATLDDDELAAALAHEQGHIARNHRFVMLVATGLRAIGWPLPGGARAIRELAFHLERDADGWALRRHDRHALARVIWKAAAAAAPAGSVATAGLCDVGVGERLRQLLEDGPAERPRRRAAAINALAAVMVACTLVLASAVPAAAVAGVEHNAHRDHHARGCD